MSTWARAQLPGGAGFGFVDPVNAAAGCSITADNTPAARIEQWFPLTAGAQYMEASYSEIWAHIATRTPLPNTCRCTERIDNGAGISWNVSLAPGASATYAHDTTFSPTGVAGPPPAPPAPTPVSNPNNTVTPAQAFGLPSNRRCVSRRNFVIRLVRPAGVSSIAARVNVNGRLATVTIARERYRNIRGGVLLRTRLTAQVDLRGLGPGRFRVTIRAVTKTLRAIQGTRRYRTCARKQAGARPRL